MLTAMPEPLRPVGGLAFFRNLDGLPLAPSARGLAGADLPRGCCAILGQAHRVQHVEAIYRSGSDNMMELVTKRSV